VPEILKSATFDAWFSGLKEARIAARIDRLSLGNPGDVKPVGSGISEMRIDYGPGYRIYFTQHGPIIIVILCGGDKRTQSTDIKRAIEIARNWTGTGADRL
jgi:putative addiction module killer protein